jgi:hypothetical protein
LTNLDACAEIQRNSQLLRRKARFPLDQTPPARLETSKRQPPPAAGPAGAGSLCRRCDARSSKPQPSRCGRRGEGPARSLTNTTDAYAGESDSACRSITSRCSFNYGQGKLICRGISPRDQPAWISNRRRAGRVPSDQGSVRLGVPLRVLSSDSISINFNYSKS